MKLEVGVKVFLQNPEGKFLLLKRSSEKYRGIRGEWDIPGGRINPEDPLLKNLAREVEEETELHILSSPVLLGAQDIFTGEEAHVVRLTYAAETDGEPVLDEEHTEYKWLSVEELHSFAELDIFAKEILSSDVFKKHYCI